MKLFKILFIALAVICFGGFAYVASIDVPVQQSLVTKTIPNTQVFHDK